MAGFVTVHMRSAFELDVQPDAGVTGPPRALVFDPLGTLHEGRLMAFNGSLPVQSGLWLMETLMHPCFHTAMPRVRGCTPALDAAT